MLDSNCKTHAEQHPAPNTNNPLALLFPVLSVPLAGHRCDSGVRSLTETPARAPRHCGQLKLPHQALVVSAGHSLTEPQINWGWKKRSFSPSPLPRQGHLKQVITRTHPGGCLQRRRFHNLSGQLLQCSATLNGKFFLMVRQNLCFSLSSCHWAPEKQSQA